MSRLTHVHCCDPEPPIPDHADLADTFCYLRRHPHTTTRRSCPASRSEASAVISALLALAETRTELADPFPMEENHVACRSRQEVKA